MMVALVGNMHAWIIQERSMQQPAPASLWVSPTTKFCIAAAPALVGCALYAIKSDAPRSHVAQRMISNDTLRGLCVLSSTISVAFSMFDFVREEIQSNVREDAYRNHEMDHRLGYTVSSSLGTITGLTASGLLIKHFLTDPIGNQKKQVFFCALPLLLGGAHTAADTAFKYTYPRFRTSTDPISCKTTFWLFAMNFIKKSCYSGYILPGAIEMLHQYWLYTGQLVPRRHQEDICQER